MSTIRLVAIVALVAAAGAPPLQAQAKSIKPGMSESEVRAVWGDPMTVRKIGDMSYMYYKNNCLRTCGTYDIVFLEKGQVVDAIVRDPGHVYDGVSSSPPGRKPEPTGVKG